jgi:hypothetical protein
LDVLCIRRLATLACRPKRFDVRRLFSRLDPKALAAFLHELARRNALSDTLVLRSLLPHLEDLVLSGAGKLRRSVLLTIGRACPNLRVLNLAGCRQVTNEIIRNVLRGCMYLEIMCLDGCVRVSDSAFEHALFEVNYGLLNLTELSVARLSQLSPHGILQLQKAASGLERLDVSHCRSITDECVVDLLSGDLVKASFAFCPLVSDASFLELEQEEAPIGGLQELHLAQCKISSAGLIAISNVCTALKVLDLRWCLSVGDDGVDAVAKHCRNLEVLRLANTAVQGRSVDLSESQTSSSSKFSPSAKGNT